LSTSSPFCLLSRLIPDISDLLFCLSTHAATMPSLGRLALFFGALLPAALAAPVAEKRNVIAGKYIVTLKSEASTESHLEWVSDVHSRSLTKRDTVGVEQTYNISSWHAYAGEFDDATLEEIKNNPDVSFPLFFWL
jgi:hypothetical protein